MANFISWLYRLILRGSAAKDKQWKDRVEKEAKENLEKD